MEIPKWLRSYLSQEDLIRIEKKVAEVERHTMGEVVPIIARRSATSGHVPFIIAAILIMFHLAFDFFLWQMDLLQIPSSFIFALNALIFFLLLYFLSPLPLLLRWLTPKNDLALQVDRRALNEFFIQRIHHTHRSTGILIFISLDEHRALVLGDDPISEKLKNEDWQKVVNLLVGGIKNKKLGQGYCDAIELCGELLKTHFPAESQNANELSNHLIILDDTEAPRPQATAIMQ